MEPDFVDINALGDDDLMEMPKKQSGGIDIEEIKALVASDFTRSDMDKEDEIFQTMNSDLDKQIAIDMEAIKSYISKTDDSIRTRIEFFNNIDNSYINKCVNKTVSNHIVCQQTALGMITWHECTKCPFKTNSKMKLSQHIESQHPMVNGSTQHECQECRIKFTKYFDLLKHIKLRHDVTVFSCEKCTFMSLDQNELREHVVAEHLKLSITWYKCAQCSYRTGKKYNLDCHVMYKHSSS